jgi:hypothetical protein
VQITSVPPSSRSSWNRRAAAYDVDRLEAVVAPELHHQLADRRSCRRLHQPLVAHDDELARDEQHCRQRVGEQL